MIKGASMHKDTILAENYFKQAVESKDYKI